MSPLIQTTFDRVLSGHPVDRETARQLAACPDRQFLRERADALRRHFTGNRFHLCSIINARSGNCTENCRFCAQSARYQTGVDTYSLIDRERALLIARDNDVHGVDRLSLVTSGHSVDEQTLGQLAALYAVIRQETGMDCCASMGFLDPAGAKQLKTMGVSRYHCNLEASQASFLKICTSHSWKEKVDTLKIAETAGMSLCSGGIIGMGESMADRIDLALELRDLGVKSIPINILTPIPGTPLAHLPPLPLDEVLTTVALFRFINPDAVIRMAGGRQQLGDNQYQCFAAGANGAIVGNFLTTTGSSIERDLVELKSMEFSFNRRECQ
jgi:biotin synthase